MGKWSLMGLIGVSWDILIQYLNGIMMRIWENGRINGIWEITVDQ